MPLRTFIRTVPPKLHRGELATAISPHTFSLFSVSVSILAWKCLIASKRSHMYRVQSSTSKMKDFLPPCITGEIDPHKSSCMSSSQSSARYLAFFTNELLL